MLVGGNDRNLQRKATTHLIESKWQGSHRIGCMQAVRRMSLRLLMKFMREAHVQH